MPYPFDSRVSTASSTSDRERRLTAGRTTVAPRYLAALAAVALAACGGGRGDTYAKAIDQQQACCEHLSGAPRDACLSEIVRVEDPAAAKASANQDSYGCVSRHFVCDPATGRATTASNQRQLDCITDLGQ